MPDWFLDDEGKHSKPHRPITKEAAAAIKSKLRALNARPIKKVAEAKARKKSVLKSTQVCLSSSEDEAGTDADESDFDVGKELSDDADDEPNLIDSDASGDENASPNIVVSLSNMHLP